MEIGGACGRRGRFFKEKAPQKPFWKRLFGGWWDWDPGLGEVRPVFAEGKDRLAVGVSLGAPFFFGWK